MSRLLLYQHHSSRYYRLFNMYVPVVAFLLHNTVHLREQRKVKGVTWFYMSTRHGNITATNLAYVINEFSRIS